jgi:hypothetical protein
MPYRDPDPEDPQVLVGVSLPAGRVEMGEMANAFAEEYAAMGFDENRIIALFHNPFYAGAHRALAALGEEEIERIARESVEVWGRFRVVVREPAEPVRSGGPVRPRGGAGSGRPPLTNEGT